MMKKRTRISLFIALMFVVPFYGKAQEVKKGNMNLGIAIGPATNFYDYSSGMRPGVYGYFEQGFWEVVPGTIALGAEAGFSFLHHDGDDFNYNWTNFFLLARGAYHYYIKVAHLDVYAGFTTGPRFTAFSDNYDHSNHGDSPDYDAVNFHFGGFTGAAYQFNNKLTGFIECGHDITTVSAGLRFKLR
jgi:hypothetical protein